MANSSYFENKLERLLENIEAMRELIVTAHDPVAIPEKALSKMLADAERLSIDIKKSLSDLLEAEQRARRTIEKSEHIKVNQISAQSFNRLHDQIGLLIAQHEQDRRELELLTTQKRDLDIRVAR